MKITIIAGARPNFMKIAPLIRAINNIRTSNQDIHARLVYTGSKEDPSLEASLFANLDMPQPDVYLGVESKDFFQRLAGIIVAFAHELEQYPTDVVLVVDDLTPTMACSIVARKKGIKIAHLVAGIRSFDMDMPKEVNRMITDGLSDILFTAGMTANRNLNQTGTEQKQVHFVGNILIDTLRHNLNRFIKPEILTSYGIKEKNYILLTINRHDILKDNENLINLIDTLLTYTHHTIIAPLHNYVQDKFHELNITHPRLHLTFPQPYLSFGYLVKHATAIVTDSGNVAEEATFLGVPCITLNHYAEHPETINIGTNSLVGEDPMLLKDALYRLKEWPKGQLPERWDGRTAERIVQTLIQEFG